MGCGGLVLRIPSTSHARPEAVKHTCPNAQPTKHTPVEGSNATSGRSPAQQHLRAAGQSHITHVRATMQPICGPLHTSRATTCTETGIPTCHQHRPATGLPTSMVSPWCALPGSPQGQPSTLPQWLPCSPTAYHTASLPARSWHLMHHRKYQSRAHLEPPSNPGQRMCVS